MAAPRAKRTGLFERVLAAPSRGPLNDKFVFSPFSVFNARDGEWQDRKRAWITLGIQSELGRGDTTEDDGSETASLRGGLTFGTTLHPYDEYGKGKNARLTGSVNGKVAKFKGGTASDYTEDKTSSIRLGIPKREDKASSYGAHLGQWMEAKGGGTRGEIRGVSIFDPVLCELMYSWFCPPGGMVLDAFAGGSVRGIVAGMMGRGYTGVDLSAKQVAANIAQAEVICAGHKMPTWLCGDSTDVVCKEHTPRADMLFSCHPASTRVLTADRGPVSIADVLLGERVFTHTGDVREVTERFAFRYTGALYSFLRDHRSYPLAVTAEHPLLVKRVTLPSSGLCECGCGAVTRPDVSFMRGHNNKGHDGRWGEVKGYGQSTEARVLERSEVTVAWVRADEVQPGDYLLEPAPQPPTNPLDGRQVWQHRIRMRLSRRGSHPRGNTTLHATADLCRLVGYYLAEGWASSNGVTFAFHEDETTYHADVLGAWGRVFGGENKAAVRPSGGDNKVVSVICNGRIGSRFFASAAGGGVGAANKRVPAWVWECSDDLLAEVVRGAWWGDGWVSGQRFGYSTVSEGLAEDLRRILLRLGILAAVRVRNRKTGYGKTWRPQWYLAVRGEHASRLAVILGVPVEEPPKRRRRGSYIEGGIAHYPVRKVTTELVRDMPVYNLEVEEEHSYLADGVASHNCPPYADLERYSDDPKDLSTMDYPQFIEAFRAITAKSARRLRPNRFACVVVGEVRDKQGYYRGFVPDTIRAYEDAGLRYYNEGILVTAAGSLPIRASAQFGPGRKLGRTHQNVLIFVKGNFKEAAAACNGPESAGVV